MKRDSGFTAIEVLLTLGVIAVTAGISVPLYRTYQVRSDLDIAVEQAKQGLGRAQVLARAGQNDSVWGYAAEEGVVFQGDAYAVREPQADEVFVLPPSVRVSGMTEVVFQRVTGEPRTIGDVVFTAANGERRVITVTDEGSLTPSDLLPPAPETSSSAATSGSPGSSAGEGMSASSTGGEASSATGGESSEQAGGGSAGSSVSGGATSLSSDSGGETGGGMTSSSSSSAETCADAFTILPDGTVETTGSVDATITVLGSEVSEGAGGRSAKVVISASTDNGETWVPLFQGKAVRGGEREIIPNLPSGTRLLLRVNGRHSWLFNRTFQSNNSEGHILVLKNGHVLPTASFDVFASTQGLASFIRGFVENGRVKIHPKSVLFLTELDALWKGSSKFKDIAVQADFALQPGSCGQGNDPKMKILFDRAENQGAGDLNRSAYVGDQAVRFAEGQWIPLAVAGVVLTDPALVEDVPGFAVERRTAGVVRVLLHGSHGLPAGKEIADARIVFDHAVVASVENDTDRNAAENPFDSIVNDGSDGDEVTIASDRGSVLFQTRVTSEDDAILIHWQLGEAGSSSAASSSSASSQGSAGDQSGSTASSSSDPCAASHALDPQGRIVLGEQTDVTFGVLGSYATYGANGPMVHVRLNASLDGGTTWHGLFGWRDILSGDTETFRDVPAGSAITLSAEGRYSWLFKRVARLEEQGGRVRVLRPGDALPSIGLLRTPADLKTFLRDRIEDGKAILGQQQLLLIAELQDLDATADFQDAVVLITLNKSASRSACGGETSTSSAAADVPGGESSSVSSSSSSIITGPKITVCHVPSGDPSHPVTIEIAESAWAAHEAHGDRRGTCAGDDDGDGVANAQDFCPGTYLPESVPTEYMLFTRYALAGTTGIFREGPRKKVSAYTLADTRGCSCEQLVDVAEGVRAYSLAQEPLLLRELQSLFPFYTTGARQYGCGTAILRMSKP